MHNSSPIAVVVMICATAALLPARWVQAQGPATAVLSSAVSPERAAASRTGESPGPPDPSEIGASPDLYDTSVGSTTGSLSHIDAQAEDRIREGTELVEQPGTFQMTGDRITFFTEMGKGRFVVLENLALERVARAIEENPQRLDWLVDGVMTEYQGSNYLLIQRAILRSQVAEDPAIF